MELEQQVLSIVSRIAKKNVELDDELLRKSLIDSITTVDLILELQEEFDCYISSTDAESIIETPKSIINYLNNLK
ncbi:phosphopantetheine-binding protein [Photorhabdus sp. APURE]|uniref:phosphopantetheine-binding protein n=1 Tax=Photorhabdus aballayi TaxID=2991723 RepID=UPI00223E8B39|nr:phosphopantetheine-binding protein [Photorhabdus aballayi]MCW7548718.1 phosphopantetheine-binding protein [Photorhabdus aballayi]